MSERSYRTSGARFVARQFGLSRADAVRFIRLSPRAQDMLMRELEQFRTRNGFPAADSAMVHGEFLRILDRHSSRDRTRRDAQDPEWVVVDTERNDRVVAYHGTRRNSRYDARDDAADRNRAAGRMRYAYKPEYALEGGF